MRKNGPVEPQVRHALADLLKMLHKEQVYLTRLLAAHTLPEEEQNVHYEFLLTCDHRIEGVQWAIACMRQA